MMVSENKVDYTNKIILAPMVRVCTLPMRLLALRYGADLVYCEEIIDHKILSAKRIENEILGTIDYVLSDGTVVFRTCPRLERGKLIFQLGTSDAKRALMAAKKVEKDVDGIDVNMGCPKEFSIKGGMGAALLTQPEKVKDILTTLVNGLTIPVTCKIRLLPQMQDVLSLVEIIESTGVSALAIHGRTKEERPRHPNRNEAISVIAKSVKIPIIANGGSKEIKEYKDIETFKQQCGSSSVMLARAAEWNPSIFRKEGVLPLFDVVKEYLKLCIDFDSNYTNVKYCVLQMMHDDMDQIEGLDTQSSMSMEQICDIWGLREYYDQIVEDRTKKQQEQEKLSGMLDIRVTHDDNQMMIIRLPVRYLKRNYPTATSPKQMLYEWTKKLKTAGKPVYITTERDYDRCYNCTLELCKTKFTTPYWEKSKQLAEQGAAICASVILGFKDGRQSEFDELSKIYDRWKKFMAENKELDFRSVARHQNQEQSDIPSNIGYLKRKITEECENGELDAAKRKLDDLDLQIKGDNLLGSEVINEITSNIKCENKYKSQQNISND